MDEEEIRRLINEFERDIYKEDKVPISKTRCIRLIIDCRRLGI